MDTFDRCWLGVFFGAVSLGLGALAGYAVGQYHWAAGLVVFLVVAIFSGFTVHRLSPSVLLALRHGIGLQYVSYIDELMYYDYETFRTAPRASVLYQLIARQDGHHRFFTVQWSSNSLRPFVESAGFVGTSRRSLSFRKLARLAQLVSNGRARDARAAQRVARILRGWSRSKLTVEQMAENVRQYGDDIAILMAEEGLAYEYAVVLLEGA